MQLLKENFYKVTLKKGGYFIGQYELTTANLVLCFFVDMDYIYIEPRKTNKIEEVSWDTYLRYVNKLKHKGTL